MASLFDPFADLTQLRRQLERTIDEQSGSQRETGRVWRPAVDLFEDEDALTLKLDLPGVDRDAVDVQLTGEELTVRGGRRWVAPEQGGCVHLERPHGQFSRVFRLGVPVQHDAVEATYRDGVLTVRLPKSEAVKPKKVTVKLDGAS